MKTINITGINKKITFKKFDKNNKSKYNYQFDLDKIKFPIVIRNKKKGDKFNPLNNKICYKLKKYYIDNKVLNIYRNVYPVLEDSTGKIIFVFPFGISNNITIKNNSENK